MDQAELRKMVICPACRADLPSLQSCQECGTEYSEVDGTPSLIPSSAARDVTVRFEQSRSAPGERIRTCLSFPPRRGPAGPSMPYHLDLAHLDVIEGLAPGSTILDVGCGGGQMRAYIESRGLRYVGVDISKTRIHEHLRIYGGPDVLCDAHFLPFRDESFDVVYSAAATQLFAFPHLAAQEAARVLKPGGHYLGNVAFLEPWTDSGFFHMTPLGCLEMLTQARFDILHIWPGENWNGFRAILTMAGPSTRPLRIFGDVANFLYRGSHWIADRLRRRPGDQGIVRTARVAGAIAWIARMKPQTHTPRAVEAKHAIAPTPSGV